MPKITLLCLAITFCAASAASRTAGDAAGQRSTWSGYERLDFSVDGRACLLVLPKTAAAGKPWIWRHGILRPRAADRSGAASAAVFTWPTWTCKTCTCARGPWITWISSTPT